MMTTIRLKISRSIIRTFLRARRKISNEKFVFLESPWVGIGNRIKGLANAYVALGKENIYLRWGLDDWVPEPFEKLFLMNDAPGFKVVSSRINGLFPLWFYPYPQKQHTNDSSFWRFWVPPERAAMGWKGKQPACDGFYYGKSENNMIIDWHSNEIPDELIDLYRPFFKQLMPSCHVEKRLQVLFKLMDSRKIKLSQLVMVQIRNCANKGDVLRVSSIGSIIKLMKDYREDQIFYLSCLEKEVSERVCEALPGRIVELPDKDYHSMIDSVADMWMLGRGKDLICSPCSTFNEVAWWWGGGKCPCKNGFI